MVNFGLRSISDDERSLQDSDEEQEGIPSAKAWGKKKSVYFGTDYVDKDFRKTAQEEEEIAQAEEEEAKAIQLRLLKEIQEDDLDLSRLPDVREAREDTVQKIEIDIDSLSKREKIELLKKESPELPSLIDDFKISLAEIDQQKRLLNYTNVDDIEDFRSSLPYRVYKTKFGLLTRYCMNISFYLLLKSKGKSIMNHPCASSLVNLKKIILDIEKIENKKKFKSMIKKFFKKIESKSQIVMKEEPEQPEDEDIDLRDYDADDMPSEPTSKKRVRFADEENEGEENNNSNTEDDIELRQYGDLREKADSEDDEDDEDDIDDDDLDLEDEKETLDKDTNLVENAEGDEEMDEDGTMRRPINYQIAKNKGLTPKKRKDQRNPRVKHRTKFRKAKARRRGQVREPRKEIKKYAGEISGIRSTTVKSIKFK